MGYIYKIYNDINDKLYIGKTLNSIEERFKQHCADSKRRNLEKRPLYNAMNKYGIEHFFVEKVEECQDDILSDRECYWIDYYNSYLYGYNATKGGDGKPIYNHQEILEELKKTLDPVLVAKKFNCCVDIVYDIGRQYGISDKYIGRERSRKENFGKRNGILQYDKKTNQFIQEFESTHEAAKWCLENGLCPSICGGVRSHIGDVANGKRKSAYGFIWKWK